MRQSFTHIQIVKLRHCYRSQKQLLHVHSIYNKMYEKQTVTFTTGLMYEQLKFSKQLQTPRSTNTSLSMKFIFSTTR